MVNSRRRRLDGFGLFEKLNAAWRLDSFMDSSVAVWVV
jgi:hypothetical protein